MNPLDVVGYFAKFNAPTVANGKVFVPTFSNCIKVYGPACDSALANLPYGNGIGLKAEYFSNTVGDDFPADADVVKLDKILNFNWGTASPAAGISAGHYKVRWTGKLRLLTNDNYTLYLTASDAVRLWIDNALVIDHWTAGPVVTYSYSLPLQSSADHDIVLEYYSIANNASCCLQWSATGICKQIIPTSQLFAPVASCVGSGSGLTAEYFSNTPIAAPFPAVPTVITTVPTINFDWGYGSPAAGVSTDLFKARFTGAIQSTDAGTYTFHASADDGVRLWVNNQLLVDGWIDQQLTEYTAQINLAACTEYPIRMEYYENSGNAICKLSWSGPVFDNQTVSPMQLTGTKSAVNSEAYKLYPNPADESVTIESPNHFREQDVIRLYDVLGRQVESNILPAPGGSSIQVPVRGLPAGVYLVVISTGGSTKSMKFVKQ
jgi:hypothetical protein